MRVHRERLVIEALRAQTPAAQRAASAEARHLSLLAIGDSTFLFEN